MPLSGSVLATKDLAPSGYQPLLLAEFQFIDGSKLYLSSAPLNTAEGGYQYSSLNWLARLSRQDLGQIMARSQDGIDRLPSITLNLEDSDYVLFNSYERASGKGFKGALVKLYLIFWEAGTSNFSTDSWIPFIGVCNQPQRKRVGKGDVLVVTASAGRNLSKIFLPVIPNQSRCANVMPGTAAQRLDGGTNMSSAFWGCGYNPDQAGTDPEIGGDCRRGNTTTANLTDAAGRPLTDSNGIYLRCNYTVADCQARGMYTRDSADRQTGRYTGITFAPPRELRSKSYLEGKTITILMSRNEAVYKSRVPMLYGAQWVQANVVNSLGDANFTACEVQICQDDIGTDGVLQVVVNGVIVPYRDSSPDRSMFYWVWVNTGSRNGMPLNDSLWRSQGDPYGSQAVIEVKVYRQLQESGSFPNIRILALGPKIKTPTTANADDQASWPKVRTDNAAFVILDTAIWTNYRYKDFNLQTFIDEANYCNGTVSYLDAYGNTRTRKRFTINTALIQRRTAAETLNAMLRACNGQLVRNMQTGLIEFMIRKTLADQQGSAVSGSNYNTPITSLTINSGVASGYAAYRFDETNIGWDDADSAPILEMSGQSEVPNSLYAQFQDEANTYAEDSLTIRDVDDISRAGGYLNASEIQEQPNILGFSSFDQAGRVLNTLLAERLRGNEIGDTRGTRTFAINARVSAAHLRVGHIVLVNWAPMNINNQLMRVMAIQPTENYERITVTVAWHRDEWYTVAFGQVGPNNYMNPLLAKPFRPPFPWQPYGEQPIDGDSVFGSPSGHVARSWWSFGLEQSYQVQSDDSTTALAAIYGNPPVNSFSEPGDGTRPPLIGPQGTTAATGGSIKGGQTIYVAIAAIDADGFESALSELCSIVIAAGTDTNTVTTPTLSWDAGTTGYVIYAGTDSQNLSAQNRANSTPSTITLDALNYETWGPPDQLADRLQIIAKEVVHAGVWGDYAGIVTSLGGGQGTLQLSGNYMTVNQFQGYDLMLAAKGRDFSGKLPIATFRVVSNTLNTLTLSPDPHGIIEPNDVIIMLSKPGTVTSTSIQDPNWVNGSPGAASNAGLVPDVEVGNVLRILPGPWPGAGQMRTISANEDDTIHVDHPFDELPDSTSRYIIEKPERVDTITSDPITTKEPDLDPAPKVMTVRFPNWQGRTVLFMANILDADGNSSLERFAPFRIAYIWGEGLKSKTVAADYAMAVDDQIILVDSTAGDVTITLPPSLGVRGRTIYVKKISSDSNSVIVDGFGGETIDDATTKVITEQYESIMVVSRG